MTRWRQELPNRCEHEAIAGCIEVKSQTRASELWSFLRSVNKQSYYNGSFVYRAASTLR